MNTKTNFLSLGIVSLFLFFSATSCNEQPKPATVHELGQMNRDFAKALVAKDAVAAASVYDENASLLPPNEPIITGRANIQAYWQGAIDAGLIEAKVETIDARSDGNLGYEIGTFELKFQLEDGTIITDIGKYTEILQRNEEGYWISLYGMWSANEPMPAE
jgi:ketosteroid isomerase-like protein